MHTEPHPLAGQTVKITFHSTDGQTHALDYRLEDWWDRVGGQPWPASAGSGNPAAANYSVRNNAVGLPFDDAVVYGKVGNFGHLIHVSEINP